jgi:beta-1,2-mannobiose phosphorylase / 1,2-beta-oligomannan phosphorylase
MRHRHTGLVRLTFISHLRVFRSRDGRKIDDFDGLSFLPANEREEFGLEDPRITCIDGRYYITYVAVSRHGPATALASTTDFKTLERHGIIFCPENKDVVLLPERVDGQYIALHRPLGDMPFCRPEMWIARSPDLVNWGSHRYLFAGAGDWEEGRVGAGAPPLATPEGWLEIYHGNRRPEDVCDIGAYCGGAMLLAKDDPGRVVKVSQEPIFEPQLEFEKEGFVARVVFPTGVLEDGDRLLIYYGASDKYCAMVEVSRRDVMSRLK